MRLPFHPHRAQSRLKPGELLRKALTEQSLVIKLWPLDTEYTLFSGLEEFSRGRRESAYEAPFRPKVLCIHGDDIMASLDTLNGKRILAVDDEPDVLEVIKEALMQSQVSTAANYEAALHLIGTQRFDLVVLDIMGVNGFALLEECAKRALPAAMLTAHAIDLESLNRAIRLGAVSFLPKDELARLPELMAEILESLAQGKTHWHLLFKRLGPFFKERLGVVWEDLEKPPYPPYMY